MQKFTKVFKEETLRLISLILITVSFYSFACNIEGTRGIAPENDLWIGPEVDAESNINKEQFLAIIKDVEDVYAPIIKKMKATLVIQKAWDDGTVNAYATRQGSNWIVKMFGGLARHKLITPDGFALVVCHEIGHHIGGAPKKGFRWASNEGQSDYWGTAKCLRKVYMDEDNEEIVKKLNVPKLVVDTCTKQFTAKADQFMCQRSAMAGLSLGSLLNSLGRSSTPVKFDTPDTNVVARTNHNHPAGQCRLDTYYQGALCDIDENEDVSQSNEETGVCYRNNGAKMGTRPLCWFKPAKLPSQF